MKYLPFEHIIYKTYLSEQEVITHLSDCIEKRRIRLFRKDFKKEYEGLVYANSFDINRLIEGRNSFLPQISGEIRKCNNETQIEVRMRLHWSVIIFTIIWCLMIFYFLITTSLKISINFFIPVFMILLVNVFATYSFKIESKRSKEDLQRIFDAKVIRE